MSKKNKKKPQQNLSLKERLSKHWDNRKWDIFVSLFARDREASMRTSWAARWNDALYNCLTAALFVDKDLVSVKMTLDVVRAEQKLAGLSPLLCDCADVASDFLIAHKTGSWEKSPLLNEADLPPSYAFLRRELVSMASTKALSGSQSETNLVKKFAAQYARLERAKTAMPYATWLKIAEQIEMLTKDTDSAETFRAVRVIVMLVHKLFLKGKGENSLRQIATLPENQLFRSIPKNQTHPAIRFLWDFFCRSGTRKYGKEWGDAARVLQLSFMKGSAELEQLRDQYECLMKVNENASLEEALLSLLRSASSQWTQWTDQEHYVLRALFVDSVDVYKEHKESSDIFSQLLESFKILGVIGRKWRPQTPWSNLIRERFEDTIFSFPRQYLSCFSRIDLPFDAMSVPSLLYFCLSDDREIAKSLRVSHAPMRLSPGEADRAVDAFLDETFSCNDAKVMKSILDEAGYIAFFSSWVRAAISRSMENAKEELVPSRYFWASVKGVLLEELAHTLPPDNPEGCLCRLCSGLKPLHFSKDTEKIDAFVNVLSPNTPLGEELWNLLPMWPDSNPDFIVRLFEKNYFLYHYENSERMNGKVGQNLLRKVGKIQNGETRRTVAVGICKFLIARANKRLRNTIIFLKQIASANDAGVQKILDRARTDFSRKFICRTLVNNSNFSDEDYAP
ncbi:MAG: hypothetical protein LBJ36_06390 [Synergistaceae bacterium]|jgi:hypothetical protein|nr:hypothetical protein [Synergistaceae bacterium]